jgi:hypothetical protein
MGRQIAVVLADEDESRLLEFLRSRATILILESFASAPQALYCEHFSATRPGHLFYDLWLTEFPWSPEFAQTLTESARWYVSNKSAAPLIEYTRFNPAIGVPGRLYWADRFLGEPAYDRISFGAHVDALWRWVRKQGRRMLLSNNSDAWCFPEAIKEFDLKNEI